MEMPIQGMTKFPDTGGDPLMMGAFVGCLYWAAGEKDAKERFKAETGYDLDRVLLGKGITAMVDKATGYDRTVVAAFGDWVVVNVWGEEGVEYPEDAT